MANPLTGYTSSKATPRALHANVNPVSPFLNGVDVAVHQFVQLIATDATEAASTVSSIVATAHVARVGDLLRFSSGTNDQVVVSVIETATNSISLGQELLATPTPGDTFEILRYRNPVVDSAGAITTSGGGGGTVDTELPPAVTAADNMANPSAPQVLSHLMGFDGITWDRANVRSPGTFVSGIAAIQGLVVNAYPHQQWSASHPDSLGVGTELFHPQQMDTNGNLCTNISSIGGATLPAHDSPVSTKPLPIGARASTAVPTAVSADGDTVRLWANRLGALKAAIVDDAGADILTTFFAGEDMAGIATSLASIQINTAGIAQDITGGGGTTLDDIIVPLNLIDNLVAVAHDDADSGNPVKTGAKAYNFDGTVPGTAVTEADRANTICDVYGRTYVETAHPRYFRATENHATAQTNNELVAAPGAGLSLYITDLVVSNGATAGSIRFVEDTGGTPAILINELYLAINGGAPITFKQPLKLTANVNFGFTSTTVTTHTIYVAGYIAP